MNKPGLHLDGERRGQPGWIERLAMVSRALEKGRRAEGSGWRAERSGWTVRLVAMVGHALEKEQMNKQGQTTGRLENVSILAP